MKTNLLCLCLLLLLTRAAHSEEVAPIKTAPERVILHTIAGDIALVLFPDIAPKHVKQFLRLVGMGVYNSTHFFRLEPAFVLQLGSAQERLVPLTPLQLEAIEKIPAEFSHFKHTVGTLSMARWDQDPNSAETSFSILLGPAPHLDGKYTIFGRIDRGIEALIELVKVPRDGNNRPLTRLTVLSAEVVDEKALEKRQLVPATPVDLGPKTSSEGAASQLLLCGLFLVLALSAAAALLRRRLSSLQHGSLHLIQVFIAAFLCLAALLPRAARFPWVGAALFAGLIAVFKLLSRFEEPA